jgi:6-phosphogluconate dehydrogenase
MNEACDIGVIGLATMGANLARNAARKGFGVAVYNRHGERTRSLVERFGHEGRIVPAETLEQFVSSLARPRSVVLVVEAGSAVDAVIEQLTPLLESGDILIDAGNSLFTDTDHRVFWASERKLRFVGLGVSGGKKGALEGPSMMPGGDREAYEHLAPILTRMAAQVEGKPCCAYIGPCGSGHYVKMIHNGIEYADVQAIAEVYDLLRSSYGMSVSRIADVFDGWRDGALSSYLMDITVDVLRRRDDETGGSLLDAVLDEAAQKGTGRWTASDALQLGVVASSTSAAVDARVLSAARETRLRAAKLLGAERPPERRLDAGTIDDLRAALLATRVIALSQGFDQLAAASIARNWSLDLAAIASLWRGGCIIRSRILDRIVETRSSAEQVAPLVLEPWFRATLAEAQAGWRRVVGTAVQDGVPVPATSAALAYFDGLRRERSAANIIQALRDVFGAHGYRRIGSDDPQHSDWSGEGTDA